MHKARWPPLKSDLENPWTAAQRFLQANELPLTYLDEVVRFIEKNSAGVSLGAGGPQYSDPYTGANSFMDVFRVLPDVPHIHEGASRYQPGSGNVPSSGTGGDPFTGASRYQPTTNSSVRSYTGGGGQPTGVSRQQPASSGPNQSGYSDPFTGANRYQPTPSPGFTPAPSSPAPPSPAPSAPGPGNVIPHVGLSTRARWTAAQFFEPRKHQSPSSSAMFLRCGPS